MLSKKGYPRDNRDEQSVYYGIEQCRAMYLFLYNEQLAETGHDKTTIRDKCQSAAKCLEEILELYDPSFLKYKITEWD